MRHAGRRAGGPAGTGWRWRAGVALCVLSACPPARLPAWQCPDGTPPPCAGARTAVPLVAVAAFDNRLRDTADAWLAATLRDELLSALAETRQVRVLDASRAPAAWTVDGSVSRAGEQLAVRLRVLRPGSREVAWAGRVDGRPADDALPATLARTVLQALGLSGSSGRAAERRTSPEAYAAYLRGQYYVGRRLQEYNELAIASFERAIALDSAFARAWAGLGVAHARGVLWGYRRREGEDRLALALSASRRATDLDSMDVSVWLTRALVARVVDPTSRTATRRALARAMALDSTSAAVWGALPALYDDLLLPDSATMALRRAGFATSDQLAFFSQHWYWRRAFDSAAVYAESAVVIDPTLPFAREVAGFAALAQGRIGAAEDHFVAGRRLATDPSVVRPLHGLAMVAAARGDSARAREYAREAERTAEREHPLTTHAALSLGAAWLAAGDTARAFGWLERYTPRGDLHFLLHLRRDIDYDAVRSAPRFAALLR